MPVLKIKYALGASLVAMMLLSPGNNEAAAHAVAIGYTPGAAAGSVNLWLGSYHNDGVGDGNDIEGSAGLTAPPSYSSSTPFSVASSSVPTGLVSGTNLFFASGFTLESILSWEGTTVTGLAAGTYAFDYIPVANPTAHWALLGLAGIQLTLTASDTSGGGTDAGTVPEPTTLTLLGVGVAALAARRRRGKATNDSTSTMFQVAHSAA
jgi:hypothetical protein